MISIASSAYDRILYPSHVRAQTHPDQLATIATLFGMNPAPVEKCRVLELGCGNGSNLAPIAWSLPDSECVGIDAAGVPIAQAQAMAAAADLKNVTFRHSDIQAVDEKMGRFDYILCHGVFSWVPPEVRDKILEICRTLLTPDGVAFISYNALPGNHLNQMVRDMVLFHVKHFDTPEKKLEQALALAGFLANAREEKDIYRQYLKQEMTRLLSANPNYILHDLLESVNAPFYFSEFTEQASRHRLQYLGEADFHEMFDSGFTPEVYKTLTQMSRDRIQREQYLDFLKCRRFRQTLLCHEGVALDLNIKPELAPRFHVAALLASTSTSPDLYSTTKEKYDGRGDSFLQVESPFTKVALALLHDLWPRSIPFAELALKARRQLIEHQCPVSPDPQTDALALGQTLLRSYAAGLVELHMFQPQYERKITERPAVHPFVRWQAAHEDYVSSVYHRVIQIEDDITRLMIGLLDGSRDRAAVQDELLAVFQSLDRVKNPGEAMAMDTQQARVILAAEIEKNLSKMARMGLFAA
jgi:methyltransferase-like protein/2-polyprenyl-3-methyl-5-hydroxy-6-metoxy-1,4-benzoquinol methylase